MKKLIKGALALVLVFALPLTGLLSSAPMITNAEEQFTYLSDMEWDEVITFEGNAPAIDKSYYQGELEEGEVRPLNIFGTEYEKGLGMHSNISVTYRLNGKATRFTAVIGPDNSCNTSDQMGHMGLKIYLDNEVKFYEVMDIRTPEGVYTVDLDLTGVNELKLEGTAEGTTWSDSMCVADAKVYGDLGEAQEGTGAFLSFDLMMPDNSPLQGIGILNKDTVYVTVPETMDKSALTAVFTTEGADDIVTVDSVVQTSGVTENDFTDPVVYRVENESGYREYTVIAGTWEDIPGHYYDGEKTGQPERPYINDYTQTLTMKLFLASPDGKGGSNVRLRFDEALDLIKEVDAVTCGIPKIFYLVGWQYEGHDDKYPSWAKANENLVCAQCDHETPEDCLRWLMDEAEKYHTKVSFHINSTDAYTDSPLWDEYVENDLISTSGGNPMAIGSYNGETAYQINYKNEWEKGYYKKRVDELLEMFPGVRRAGTIHSDAFFCRSSDQSTLAEEQEARRKMIRYWRDCGVDLTSEFLYSSNGSSEYNYDGVGTGLIGLMPMVWHFNQAESYYMRRPAALVTGGSINPGVTYGGEQKNIEILFGRSMWGETLLTNEGTVGPSEGWEQNFIDEFCASTLTWAYLNQYERLDFTGSGENRKVTYSDGVMTSLSDRSITENGHVLRSGDDIFIPASWNEEMIIAYSKDGYTQKTWEFPGEWDEIASVDLFAVSKSGLISVEEKVDCSDGVINLSLEKGQMLVVAPAGTIETTAPSRFAMKAPADQETGIDPEGAVFQWEASRNAVKYQVAVAENKEMTKNLQERNVTDTSIAAAEFELKADRVYYWNVTAVAKTGESTRASNSPCRFTTVLTGTPECVENVKILRLTDECVRLQWDAQEIPYQYQILRRALGGDDFEVIASVNGNLFEDTDAPRKWGQIYEYKIRTLGADGRYADSEIVFLDHETYLSDLEWHSANPANPNETWGVIHKDENLEGNPIRIGGDTYEKGLEMHADSDVTYGLNGEYDTFRAVIGTDDVNVERSKPTTIRLTVLADGNPIFESEEITIRSGAKEIELDVSGINELQLKVEDTNGSADSDWGVWAAARLTPNTVQDKLKLRDLYDLHKDKEKGNYTDESWEVFRDALAAAKDVLAGGNAAKKEINEAYQKLEDAVKGLKLKENTEDGSQSDQEEDNKTNQDDDKRTDQKDEQKAAKTGDTSTATLGVILLAAAVSAGIGSYCLYQRKKR